MLGQPKTGHLNSHCWKVFDLPFPVALLTNEILISVPIDETSKVQWVFPIGQGQNPKTNKQTKTIKIDQT